MSVDQLELVCAQPGASLLEVLAVIDKGAHSMCCLVDDDRRLLAVLTDGDVRRALLGGASLSDRALEFASRRPLTVVRGATRAHVLDLMKSLRVSAIPEVDEQARLFGLHTLSDIIGGTPMASPAVIMAGGRGERLGELTKATPKPLMKVAGRPILEWIILGLVGDGVRQIYISVNYLADAIVETLGTGESLGCRIDYLREAPEHPLGTAGALTLLPKHVTDPGQSPILVMNGDLMVEFDARALITAHNASGAAMSMGTRGYTHTVPFGVVEVDDRSAVRGILEKPDLTVQVNTAVYCIDPSLVHRLPYNQPSTMPQLVQMCLDDGLDVTAWPINSEWIDVGTPADLARAKGQE